MALRVVAPFFLPSARAWAGNRVAMVMDGIAIALLLAGAMGASVFRVPGLAQSKPSLGRDARLVARECGEVARPNEPKGFTRFAELDADSVPPFPSAPFSRLGRWYAFPKGNPNLIVVQDLNAPCSPPGVIRTRYPSGFPGGRGPVDFGGWNVGPEAREKRAIYFAVWIRINGRSFENQAVGTKAGFISFGRNDKGYNEGTFFLVNPSGRQAIQSKFTLQFKQQGIKQANGQITRNLGQNVSEVPLMTVGEWHRWEAVLHLNSRWSNDGILRMWVDGKLVMNYSDVIYSTPDAPLGFVGFKWNPTWGGSGGVRTRDDFIDIDHIYLSGLGMED